MKVFRLKIGEVVWLMKKLVEDGRGDPLVFMGVLSAETLQEGSN